MRITPALIADAAPRRVALGRRTSCAHGNAERFYARWQEGGDIGHLRICECGHVEGLGPAQGRLQRQQRRGTQERGIRLTIYRNPATEPRIVVVRLSEHGAEIV
jgi:hypothetical protein